MSVVRMDATKEAISKTLMAYAKEDLEGVIMLVSKAGTVEYCMVGDYLEGYEAVHYLMLLAAELDPVEYEEL